MISILIWLHLVNVSCRSQVWYDRSFTKLMFRGVRSEKESSWKNYEFSGSRSRTAYWESVAEVTWKCSVAASLGQLNAFFSGSNFRKMFNQVFEKSKTVQKAVQWLDSPVGFLRKFLTADELRPQIFFIRHILLLELVGVILHIILLQNMTPMSCTENCFADIHLFPSTWFCQLDKSSIYIAFV